MIKHSLCDKNHYLRKFVANAIDYNLPKRNRIPPNLREENNSKEILINLKYAGQTGKQLMLMLKKIIKKLLKHGFKTKIVHNSPKLCQYFDVKDTVSQKCKRDLVYKCTCPQTDNNFAVATRSGIFR